jgi:hypothetical protein
MTKLELTKTLLNQLPPEQRFDLDVAMRTWWYNLRKSGGLRLTDVGYLIFKQFLNLEHYEYSLKENPIRNLSILLKLDQRLQAPYYLIKHKGFITGIAFFHGKEAVLANLYGDIENFLSNYHK